MYIFGRSISAGKSTLCRSIEHNIKKYNINYKHYPEPINQKLLELFYSNIDKYSFAFQCIIIRERVHLMEEAINYLYSENGNMTVIDRSAIGDCAFALMLRKDNKINNEEFEVYADLTKSLKQMVSPSVSSCKRVIVYLNCESNKARERVINRGNAQEIKSCTPEYLENLNNSYNKVLSWNDSTGEELLVIKQVYDSIGTMDVISIDYNRDFRVVNGILSESDTFMILKEIIDQL